MIAYIKGDLVEVEDVYKRQPLQCPPGKRRVSFQLTG